MRRHHQHRTAFALVLALTLVGPAAAQQRANLAHQSGINTHTRQATARGPKAAAAVELQAHAAKLGLSVPRRGPRWWRNLRTKAAVVRSELRRARKADPRSGLRHSLGWMARFSRAQHSRPAKISTLFGFSRMYDAKVKLSGSLMQRAGADPQINQAEVLRLIDQGPGSSGRWGFIDSPEKLLAAMVRHQVKGEGSSLQLSISPGVSDWLSKVVRDSGAQTSRAVGGAGAYGANLASAFRRVRVGFHSAQPISPEQAKGFTSRVRVVTADSGPRGLSAQRAADPSSPTKVNYIIEAPANLAIPMLQRQTVRVDGRDRALRTPGQDGRIILSTKASYAPTFDPTMTRAQLGALAKANDLFVMVGVHYLTGYDKPQLKQTGQVLRRQLQTMRRANPRLKVHYQYVRAKDPAKEYLAFDAIQGQVDSMSLNATELGELVRNLSGQRVGGKRLQLPRVAPATERATQEDPARIYGLGKSLMRELGLKRLHVHGFDVDMVLVQNATDRQLKREGTAAMRGRQLGINKVVGLSGQIRSRKDVWRMVPTVSADGLAAVQRFADHLAQTHQLGRRQRDRLARGGRYIDPADHIGVSFTPTRQSHINRGGLVSLGDTLDITTLLHSQRP